MLRVSVDAVVGGSERRRCSGNGCVQGLVALHNKAPIGPAIGCLPPLARVLPLLLRLRHLPLPLGWGRGKKVCGGGGGGGGGFEPSEGGGGSRKGARRSGPFMKQNFGYFLPSELKKIPDLTPARPYGV